MLKEFMKENLFQSSLPADFSPYPTILDREFWESLPDDGLKAVADEFISKSYGILPLSTYLLTKTKGDRATFEALYFERRNHLAFLTVAECLENKGRYFEQIQSLIWCICEEMSWCIPAHEKGFLPDLSRPTVDLFAAETAAHIAMSLYLLKPLLEEKYSMFIKNADLLIKTRVLEPYLANDDYGWMGFKNPTVNNWNPWINSNVLFATLANSCDVELKRKLIEKTMISTDFFINCYHEDGGCDEGPHYWKVAGGALFDYLELLSMATEGKTNTVFENPKIKNIGSYIYKAYIGGQYYVNFADAWAKPFFNYGNIAKHGEAISDEKMISFAKSTISKEFKFADLSKESRIIDDLILKRKLKSEHIPFAPLRDVFLPDICFMSARERSATEGFFIAAKGGHNQESHNHNDVGSFMVFYNNCPVFIDVGCGVYEMRTFSSARYEIWNMQSQYHNLPTINGVMQENGIEFCATDVHYETDDEHAKFSLSLKGAYPPSSKVRSWQRTLRLNRQEPASICITDDFSLADSTKELFFSFMTPCPCSFVHGKLILSTANDEKLEMHYDSELLSAKTEVVTLLDKIMKDSWGDKLYRIVFKAQKPVEKACVSFKIMRGENEDGKQ